MQLEEQVCTVEQAKKLDELGVFDRGIFHWREFENKKTKEVRYGVTYGGVGEWQDMRQWKPMKRYSAFTVAELFVMNDEYFVVNENECHSLASIIANRLIKRIENNSLQASEVNQRLLNHKEQTI